LLELRVFGVKPVTVVSNFSDREPFRLTRSAIELIVVVKTQEHQILKPTVAPDPIQMGYLTFFYFVSTLEKNAQAATSKRS
jgi:hypothetical protein